MIMFTTVIVMNSSGQGKLEPIYIIMFCEHVCPTNSLKDSL